jgi:hypothetical protein
MIYQGKARYPVREAVLHCAAIRTGQFAHMRPFQVFATINQWHHERGFKNGFGYHGLFMPDGEFFSGRPYDNIGAHVLGHNAGTLGFLLIESRQIVAPKAGDPPSVFSDWFTSAQRSSVKSKLQELRENIGLEKVSGHNDYAPKLCPGFKVISSEWM